MKMLIISFFFRVLVGRAKSNFCAGQIGKDEVTVIPVISSIKQNR